MRLHRNLVYTNDSLNAIFNEGEYADKVVARALKKDKRWGSSDRKFVAETIYEVRWKRLYAEIAK
jgi:16S rRNA (cytosine967-C5)-methyltransferase